MSTIFCQIQNDISRKRSNIGKQQSDLILCNLNEISFNKECDKVKKWNCYFTIQPF